MARRSRLFSFEDYEAMLDSKSTSELFNYLSNTSYRKEILINHETDLLTLQSITYQNYAREVLDFYNFSSTSIRKLLRPIFLKLDMLNLITLIRGKEGGLKEDYLKKFLVPSPQINPRLFFEIYKLPLSSLLDSLSTPLVDGVRTKKTPREMENLILRNWLKQFLLVPKSVQSYFSKALFAHEVLNRIKASLYYTDFEPLESRAAIIPKEYSQVVSFSHQHLETSSTEPEFLQTEIEKYILDIRSPHGLRKLDSIINYLDSKEIETRNVRIIGAGIESGLDKSELKGELIYENSSSV